ncbi:MAG: hypothetical protein KF873_04715 [Gemmataceae bacterium]|nr:hypothetical protein [Planctomycetia bacterium]MBX3398020.1 hypothetical protein [Gemmataceae bacterium]
MEEPPGFREKPIWLLAIVALAIGQAGLAYQLFGGPVGLRDDRPVVAGRHPLHFYHGMLGADTLRQRAGTSCYDPNFQAGYPKTPVFDGGCRPVELLLALFPADAGPRAYKLGLFWGCILVPFVFALAARGAGLTVAGSTLAAALGCAVWWSPTVRDLLDDGHLDFLIAGLASVCFVAWLARYQRDPGLTAWCVVAFASLVGWFGHPVVWIGLAPIVGLYYLAAAPRHGLAWHLGLFGTILFGLLPNLNWLWDWSKFWWLRQPSVDDIAPLPTWGAVVDSWAGHAKLLGPAPFGWPLVAVGFLGCVRWLREGRRGVAALFLLTASFAFFIARLGTVWSPLSNGEADRAAALVVALATIPAAGWFAAWGRKSKIETALALGAVGAVLAFGWGGPAVDPARKPLNLRIEPLALGLSADQQELVRGLGERTTPAARILMEETPTGEAGWNWTALLPWLTQRAYLGGLDPDAKFEHAFCRLRGDTLNGRRLVDWTDAELEEFARRYNVGWVVARSPAARDRWQRVTFAREVARYKDGGDVRLFELDRPRSFVLVGSANWDHADRRKIVLTDVVPVDAPNPDGGPVPVKVVGLSLHYQAGLRAGPGVISIERDPDPYDPIPMLRLRVTGPLSRVVISWENP